MRRAAPAIPSFVAFVTLASGCVRVLEFPPVLTAPRFHDYLGVIGGPDRSDMHHTKEGALCPAYLNEDVLAKSLASIGVTSIRNNDYRDDTLDLDLLFNCSGTPYGMCPPRPARPDVDLAGRERGRGPATNATPVLSPYPPGSSYPCWRGCTITYPTDCKNSPYLFYTGGTSSDARFDGIVNRGFEPFLRLGSEGNVLATLAHRTQDGPLDAEEEANWIQAALCVADRYDNRSRVRYLDVLTETNQNYWDRPWDELVSFFYQAVVTLKKTFGDRFKVGGPGVIGAWMGPVIAAHEGTGSCDEKIYARDLLTAFAGRRDGLVPDWFGMHVLSNDPRDYARAMEAMHALLDGTGPCFDKAPWAGAGTFARTELIMDAWGPTDVTGPVNPYRTGGLGAALTIAVFILMQRADIARAFVYRADDVDGSDDKGGKLQNGLCKCDETATPHPRGYAFRLWQRLLAATKQVGTIHARPEQGDVLYALEGVDPTRGTRAVLVANLGSSTVDWTPQWSGAPAKISDYKSAKLYQVDATSQGEVASSVMSDTVSIPGAAAQLLVLSQGTPAGPPHHDPPSKRRGAPRPGREGRRGQDR